MKCKYCNGTGYNDTQRGAVITEFPPCPWCGGSGYVKDKEQTNEEWFNGLSTIEKAKALHKLHWEMQNHFNYSPDDEDYVEEYCLYWLKAIHK